MTLPCTPVSVECPQEPLNAGAAAVVAPRKRVGVKCPGRQRISHRADPRRFALRPCFVSNVENQSDVMAARPAKVVGKPGNARLNHVGTLYNTFATAPRVNDLTPTTPLCEGLFLRHSSSAILMSALGHKRTWRLQFAMSALHSIADIHCGSRNVTFGPLSSIWRRSKNARLGREDLDQN
jgi:hypothetical protein